MEEKMFMAFVFSLKAQTLVPVLFSARKCFVDTIKGTNDENILVWKASEPNGVLSSISI